MHNEQVFDNKYCFKLTSRKFPFDILDDEGSGQVQMPNPLLISPLASNHVEASSTSVFPFYSAS